MTGVIAALLLVLTSCGSGGDAPAADEAPASTTTVAPDSSTSAPTDPDEQAQADEADAESPPAEEEWAEIFPEIVLSPTEAGPRPVLGWSEVPGATLYQLTVLDADGVPYWSWSGTEIEVPLGGMENPDAIGALVFEELTWMVVARDDAGTPLGMSRRGVLQP